MRFFLNASAAPLFNVIKKFISQRRKNHYEQITKLQQITAKYNYDGMTFHDNYQCIQPVEDLNSVCTCIYELDDDNIRLIQAGNIDYLTNDFMYLLRIDDQEDQITEHILITFVYLTYTLLR